MNDFVFDACRRINEHFEIDQETQGRNELIRLLDYLSQSGIPYNELVNHLIRKSGILPYMDIKTCSWEDNLVHSLFSYDTLHSGKVILHREQSKILKLLLEGKNLAISAPTSFGKSYIIDSYIDISQPNSVVIIVPTIALADEARRRLTRKFGNKYSVITTSEEEVTEKTIIVCPQERAIGYIESFDFVDLLVVDEFYKAGMEESDDERSLVLRKAIIEYKSKSKQCYFLAPNINSLADSIFTDGIEFISIDFNTVVSDIFDYTNEITGAQKEEKKKKYLLSIVKENSLKSLVYTCSIGQTITVFKYLTDSLKAKPSEKLSAFSKWIEANYGKGFVLAKALLSGVGMHNGSLHRPLSQLQIKMFEGDTGLNTLVSTSSIIEGVNTSAENVIIWSNKRGLRNYETFTYKNIIGRSGRMFKHFVGKVYVFEKPQNDSDTDLLIDMSDEVAIISDGPEVRQKLTKEQIAKIIAYNNELEQALGRDKYNDLFNNRELKGHNPNLIKGLIFKVSESAQLFVQLDKLLYRLEKEYDISNTLYFLLTTMKEMYDLTPSKLDLPCRKGAVVKYINDLFDGYSSLPELFDKPELEYTIEEYFKCERFLSFKVASFLNMINVIRLTLVRKAKDLSPVIYKMRYAFLPKFVFQLEEYGLPRMISLKIHLSGAVSMDDDSITLKDLLLLFSSSKIRYKISLMEWNEIEKFILNYFYEGIDSAALFETIFDD